MSLQKYKVFEYLHLYCKASQIRT